MDILGFDGQRGPRRDFTVVPGIRCVYRAELIGLLLFITLADKLIFCYRLEAN